MSKTEGPLDPAREVKQWENNVMTWDLSQEFKRQNKKLTSNFGKDRYSYRAENTSLNAVYWAYNEPKMAHGYPATAWMQLGLLYMCGMYTAKEQGIVKQGVPFARFWRAHYFDWIMFARRGVIYAWAGGLIAGTVMFGKPELALKRAVAKYHFYFSAETLDIDGNQMNFMTKQN